ncbi:MAG: sodium:calcium antiporter [Proteobacteria bacterium]|nr:sodium:calcium antiporter [Pseudomonadota bacterium]
MTSLFLTVVLLLVAAGAIYFSCEYFVNGVEWAGHKFNVEQTATGTILAAFGTALPESVVTFVAVAFGHDETQKQLGIGAALGGPLVLATIAYATVGWVMLARARTAPLAVDYRHLSRDQGWFLAIFVVKIALGLVVFAFKPWLGVLFLAAYAVYFWKETTGRSDEAEGALEPLMLAPRQATPSTALVLLQTGGALVAIFIASQVFVHQLDSITPHLGLSPQLVALLISPIATELPETMNAIIWVRQGKERLALANISGAMMIQATVPTAFGIFFTPWLLDPILVWAGAVTAISIAALFMLFRRGRVTGTMLSFFGLFYLLFAIILVLTV